MQAIAISASFGRRFIRHPGSPSADTMTIHAAAADELHVWLAPGKSLFQTIVETLAGLGFNHGSLQMFDGDLVDAKYQTAPPDPTGELAVAYGPPIGLVGGARIVMANATLGRKADGSPIVHCHGVLMDRAGNLKGGHIPTDLCAIGDEGVPAWVVVSKDDGFVVRPDDETHFSLLSPVVERN